jgi:hypothetical protein
MIAIQHYRLLQQQRRATTTTTTTTTLTHLQKTDKITKMIRGKQEDTVGAVEGRQVVQEEEEEMNTGKEEEEIKTENMKGTKSNENLSSGASGASGARSNIAQNVLQRWLMTQNRLLEPKSIPK